MKQKYVALKMYLVGMTVGMFILGWSAVANTDAVQTNTGSQTASSTVTTQTHSSSQQAFVAQPRIRTRTS
jgi:hypothetical protein